MQYYEVTVQILKDDEFDRLEKHYAIGARGGQDAAALSVKNELNRTLPAKYPGSNIAVILVPGGVIEITKEYYNQQHKEK